MEKEIKCIVWDLDNTIWDGVLLESENIQLKQGVADIIKTLDKRGILQSIASKNNHEDAFQELKRWNLDEYFIYPEINWNAKSSSLSKIQKNLNLGMDTFLFIDDQPFERDEVKTVHEKVECIDSTRYTELLDHPRLNPQFITVDSAKRRKMYMDNIKRQQEEEIYNGTPENFLASLNLKFIISPACENDLQRAEELTLRTNQLNATGVTYGFDELKEFIESDKYMLLICELTDRYGSYGKIGLALIEVREEYLHLKLLLMSCRVMSRGVGSVLLTYIMNVAKKAGKKLIADFKRTDRNRQMYVTYKFMNFKIKSDDGNQQIIFENDLSVIPGYPGYIVLEIK